MHSCRIISINIPSCNFGRIYFWNARENASYFVKILMYSISTSGLNLLKLLGTYLGTLKFFKIDSRSLLTLKRT
jgi:hypothetical protein